MGLLISEDDFIGKWELTKSSNDLIDNYIEEYEEQFLTDLLGKELFDLFKGVLDDSVPPAGIYKDIYDPFTKKINSLVVTSDGMKKMLLGLIYAKYVPDNRIKQTMNGAVEQQSEVATQSDNTFLYLRYNKAVDTFKAIQFYIMNNMEVYPTFYGIRKIHTSFI